MNDDESETRTRAQRDAALQEGISAFNQHIRNLNKMTRRIHSTSARANADPNELQDCVNEYEAILEELSTVYDQIRELSFDSPPQKTYSPLFNVFHYISHIIIGMRIAPTTAFSAIIKDTRAFFYKFLERVSVAAHVCGIFGHNPPVDLPISSNNSSPVSPHFSPGSPHVLVIINT